jgi:hypothetical protein
MYVDLFEFKSQESLVSERDKICLCVYDPIRHFKKNGYFLTYFLDFRHDVRTCVCILFTSNSTNLMKEIVGFGEERVTKSVCLSV